MGIDKKLLIFFGPPGCGKGTQAEKLAKEYGFEHVSTGEILRKEVEAGSEIGQRVKDIISAGKFAPPELVTELAKPYFKPGVILDGYPRTLDQAQAIPLGNHLIVVFNVSKEECVRRISGRNQGRADDTPEVAAERYETYLKEANPIIKYFESKGEVKFIDAEGEKKNTTNNMLQALNLQ